jgi:transcriptional regulator GlxA family with amidase domain
MRIHILVLDEVFDTGLAALLDTFGVANDLASDEGGKTSPPFDVSIVGVRPDVHTSRGFLAPVIATKLAVAPDVLLIPALGSKTPETLRLALVRRDIAEARAFIQKLSGEGVLVGAVCTGTFILADTGLLNGQSATTSWWLAPLFRERYPCVRLEESRMLVSSPGFVTAGAALAHVDLALWLIRRVSPALATLAARYLLIDSRPSQAVFALADHLAHNDPLVERFERWARSRLGKGFSLDEAASAVGSSKRTLSRRLQLVLGKTPLSYFQDLRVERAVHLLRTSSDSVDLIALQVGYEDGATLRALLRRKMGRAVSELRSLA